MSDSGGGGRVGAGSACPPADASTPDTHGTSVPTVGAPRGVDPVRVKNKQWTRRVDGLAPRPDPDSGLLFSNWLKFSLKKSFSEESELVEEDEDMGNLQGGESKKKDAGKSPMKEKKRGFLSKKPVGPKVQAPTPPVAVDPPPPEAEHQSEHHNGTRPVGEEAQSMADTGTRLFATESWRAVNQVGSRESSSESIFMDPLSSPRAPEAPAEVLDSSPSASLVPPDSLISALVLPRSDSPSASLVPLRTESSSISQQPEDSSSLTQQPDDSSSLDDVTLMEDEEEEGFGLGDASSMSEAVTEPPLRPTSFTVNKHRKVELGSITGSLALQSETSRRHASLSDTPTESNVLRKVASLTLDGNSAEQKLSRPKAVPEKLDYHIYDKFEGQQLLNWFVGSFPEDHYLRMLLTTQDLRILGAQFCTHMLAAGVLRQIPDKDAPLDPFFRPDLMYVWTHTETSAVTPATPGRLPPGMWTPHASSPPPASPSASVGTPTRPGARYTEADCGTPGPRDMNPMTASTASVDKVIRKIEAEEFQQVMMGLKREHKDSLVKLTRGQEVKMFTLRGEHAHKLQEQEQTIVQLTKEVESLRRELDSLRTIAEIQDLTKRALSDFDSPSSPRKKIEPNSLASPVQSTAANGITPSTPSSAANGVAATSPSAANGVPATSPSAVSSQLVQSPSQVISSQTSFSPQSSQVSELSSLPPSSSNERSLQDELREALEEENLPEKDASSAPDDATVDSSLTKKPVTPSAPKQDPPRLSQTDLVPSSSATESGAPPPPSDGLSTPQESSTGPPPPPMPSLGPPPPPMPSLGSPPPPMPAMGPGPPPPPMPGMGPGPPPPPMPGMGPPPPPMPGMGPPPPPMPGMGPPPPPMPGMGPPPPPMPGMGPPPPPMPGMGPPPPPMPGSGPPPPPPAPGMGPPPPPIPGGGPPPPMPPMGPTPLPAPPVGGWNAQRAVLRKPPLTPAVPMKPLFWSRIIVPVADTPPVPASPSEPVVVPLWEQLEEAPIEDLTEFNALFSRQIAARKPTKKKVLEPARAVAAKILDSKRSQNVGILASSLHVDFSEIENAVYNFDTSVVSLEALHQIYEARATPEELEQMKAHVANSPDVPLDKPEQFLLELSDIPNFAERIACFMFQTEYEDVITGIDSKLNNIKSVCDTLCGDGVKNIMATILALGNYMNGGNMARGQADGFALDILPRLRDVKSTDSSVTLLHFLVRTVLRRGPTDAALPLPEPGDIARAAAVDASEVAAELSRLESDLAVCERKMQAVISSSSEDNLQPFKDKMTGFLESAKQRLKGERDNLEECQTKFKATAKFYQFRPKSQDEAVSEFFGIWAPFAKDFKDIWKKEQQRLIKEKMQEIKKKQEDLKREVKPVKAGGLKDKMRQRLSQHKTSS